MADRWCTAQEAAAELGVTLATLYAYASRGLLHSEAVPGEPRARRYPREDVERLKGRKELRREPERAVPKALHWGPTPVLESAITLIDGGRLYYRGRDAIGLARHRSVEEVAALLWAGDPGEAAGLFAGNPPELPAGVVPILKKLDLAPVERCQVVLPLAGAADLASWDLRPRSVAATGARLLRLLARVLAGGPGTGGVAEILQKGWAPGRPEAAGPIAAALILAADHELNVSAFTARCAASAGASPYDVVTAGLAALKGARHGGHTRRMEAVFREAGSAAGARQAVADRLRRGEEIPGTGHALYPDGDPRGKALLDLAVEAAPGSPAVALAEELARAFRELLGDHPNLDFGLVALARALDLPPDTPLALFALGRTIGWIGHAIEEYAQDRLIRPRAAYVGEPPAEAQASAG